MYNPEKEAQFESSENVRDSVPPTIWDDIKNSLGDLSKTSTREGRPVVPASLNKDCISFGQASPRDNQTITPDLPKIGLGDLHRPTDRTQFPAVEPKAPTNDSGRSARPVVETPGPTNEKPGQLGDGHSERTMMDPFEHPPSGRIGESTWSTPKDVAEELAAGKIGDKALNSMKAVLQTMGPEGLKKYVEKINEQLKDKNLKLNAGETIMMSCYGTPETNGKSYGVQANLVDTNKNEKVSEKSTWISGPAARKQEQEPGDGRTPRGPKEFLPPFIQGLEIMQQDKLVKQLREQQMQQTFDDLKKVLSKMGY